MVADSNFVQSSFLAGEWSPLAQGRIDRPDYKQAMNACRNGIPLEEGAWVRRPGMRYAATTLGGAYARVIPFAFEQNAPYIMEMSNVALRMFAVGAQTLNLSSSLPSVFQLVTDFSAQVTSISTANPAVVQTNSPHGMTTGNQVEFLFSGVAPTFTPLLRNRTFAVTLVDATHVSLTDAITGAAIDGSTLGWASQSLGNVVMARIVKMTTPYAAVDLPLVRKIQAQTSALFFHNLYQPQILTATAPPVVGSFATFGTMGNLNMLDGPYLDPPQDGSTLTPSAAGSGSITVTANAITSINGGQGFQSTDVGRHIRLFSQPPAWNSGTSYSVGQSVWYNGQAFTCVQAVTGGANAPVPDTAVASWQISTSAAYWVWGTISAVTSTTVVSVSLQACATDYTKPSTLGYASSNSILTWRLGAYSNTTGWPSCAAYYEGRLWTAGSIANRIDASVSNGIHNVTTWQKVQSGGTFRWVAITAPAAVFSPTLSSGQVVDSNGISATFNCEDTNPILWILGTQTALLCGTLAGEWAVQSSTTANPLTPTNIQAHRVTKYGCANIEPEHTDITVSFVHRHQQKVLEYFPDVFSGRYTAPNLSQMAKHLTSSGIQEIRYQRELAPIIWARNGNGSLIGATYKRTSLFSSQGPEFIGWHRHDLGSGRTLQSIAVGPSPDGTMDTLAAVTLDSVTGLYHVEFLGQLTQASDTLLNAWFADDSIVPSGGAITINSSTGNTLTLYGLWHLNGKKVTVWCGGVDAGDATVASGSITVPIDASFSATFSSSYMQSLSSTTAYGTMTCPIAAPAGLPGVTGGAQTFSVPCVVGFTYTSQGQLVRPDSQEMSRSPTGPALAKPRRAHQFGALLNNAQGLSFGTNFAAKMHTANFKQLNGTPYAPTQLYSGVYWDTLEDQYSFDGMLAWQLTRPYPASVCSVTPFANFQDR